LPISLQGSSLDLLGNSNDVHDRNIVGIGWTHDLFQLVTETKISKKDSRYITNIGELDFKLINIFPTGPMEFPIIGNLPHFVKNGWKSPNEMFHDLCLQHGPILSVSIGAWKMSMF
jgi:hypothetical protein